MSIEDSMLDFCARPAQGTKAEPIAVGKTPSGKWQKETVKIQDCRGFQFKFSHEKNGFEFVKHQSLVQSLQDENKIPAVYYAEIEALMKRLTGANYVSTLLHLYRSSASQTLGDQDTEIAEPKYYPVARRVHCDYSYSGAPVWVEHMPTRPRDWDRLCEKRWALYSVWRPLAKVTSNALCVADSDTVSEKNLVEGISSHVAPEIEQEFGLWFLQHDPAQRFYYKSDMDTDDVLILKLFDTKTEGCARYCLHCSFTTERNEGLPRKSIELRCLVVWDEPREH